MPLIFGVGARCSLTHIIHLPTDEVIQLHRNEMDGNDMRLRARSLSIAFLRKDPFCFYKLLPKISSSPLVFGAGARYSLIQTIHLPMNEVIQLR